MRYVNLYKAVLNDCSILQIQTDINVYKENIRLYLIPNYNLYVNIKMLTFLRSSGFPFFTVATIMSPEPAAGSLFKRPLIPWTAITYRFFAPVLSAQLITAPTGKPKDILNLAPAEPPRPRFDILNDNQLRLASTIHKITI